MPALSLTRSAGKRIRESLRRWFWGRSRSFRRTWKSCISGPGYPIFWPSAGFTSPWSVWGATAFFERPVWDPQGQGQGGWPWRWATGSWQGGLGFPPVCGGLCLWCLWGCGRSGWAGHMIWGPRCPSPDCACWYSPRGFCSRRDFSCLLGRWWHWES